MALYLYKNGDMSLVETTNKVTTPSLCYYKNGTKYIPLITKTGSVNIGNNKWSYTTVRPTIHVVYNNNEYVVPNDSQALPYDIPAGTYIGQGAYDIFKEFISNNSYRILKYSVTIVHKGIARTFPANTRVWLIYGYSGQCINLCFQTSGSPAPGVDAGYSSTNSWWSSTSTNPVIQLRVYNGQGSPTPWSGYNFTITDEIKFK